MQYGLEQEDIERIQKVFAQNPKVKQVIIFGSRAMGNYNTGSDIDLAVSGDSLSLNDLLDLSYGLEQLGLLYSFDLQNLNSIKDLDVLAHIERVGKVFYQ